MAVLVSLLSACGGGAKNAGEADTPAGKGTEGKEQVETAPKEKTEPVDIIFYSDSGGSVEEFENLYGAALKKKFPNYNVTYLMKQKGGTLRELLTAGQTIDIIYDSIGMFPDSVIGSGLSYDMSGLIKEAGVDLNKLEPTMLDAMRKLSNGGLYGLPVRYATMLLYYNKDIFDKFGVEYPVDGMTWEQTIELGNKLTRSDGDVVYAGFSISEGHYMRMNPFSLPYVDSKAQKVTINSDEKWKTFFQTILVAPTESAGYQNYFSAKKLSKMPSTNEFSKSQDLAMLGWLSGAEFPGMNVNVVAMPTFSELPGVGTQAYPTYYSVTSTSKHKKEAMEIIAYLVSEEFQMILSKRGILPAVQTDAIKNAFGSESNIKNLNTKAFFYNKLAPISEKLVFDSAIETEYRKDVGKLVTRQIDLNTFLRNAEERGATKLKEELSK
jgi:multiple sugar transport system substrate-binding protein